MKKATLLSALFTMLAVTIITAAKAQKGFYVSAQGAPQLSVMFNTDEVDEPGTDYRPRFSGAIGLGAGYNFTKNLGVGTELMYSVERQRYINNSVGHTQRNTYLKMPLMFTFNTNPARIMFTAKAGPQIGLLLNSKITDADNKNLNGDTRDKYKTLTFSAMAGAGARVRMSKNIYLDAGVRLDGTFTNPEDKNFKDYTAGRAKTYNVNAGFDVGIKYFLN